jgi:hypothetical protein
MFDVAELEQLNQKAAAEDVSFASDSELLAAVEGLARARASFDAAELHVLGELDARGVCDREFGSRTATWVAHVTGGDRRAIASRVTVAGKLRGLLGGVDAALSAGELTFEHARVLATAANPRITAELAAEQDGWIAKAAVTPLQGVGS